MRAALVIVVGVLVGCSIPENLFHPPGGGGDGGMGDGFHDAFSGVCDPFMQTGCAPATEKCTWITTGTTPEMGQVGCAPRGIQPTGASCTVGPPGVTTGYDNCMPGNVCEAMTCKQICNSGHPCTGTAACNTYSGFFQDGSAAPYGGLCDPECDPLKDNDFLNAGSKLGTVCSASQGCFGNPSTTDGMPTRFNCAAPQSTTSVHRTPCTAATNCMQSGGGIYLNGCAQGYEPLLQDSVGSMQVDCIALCAPGNAYSGNPGTQFPAGQPPHMCSSAAPNNDARGTFNPAGGATTTVNGDHCMFWWSFEIDQMGMIVLSPFSDTVGICLDHTKYPINPNDVTVACQAIGTPAGCVAWPTCASLPLTSTGNVLNATQLGCVDTSHLPVAPQVRPAALSDLRRPYTRR